MKRAFVCTMSVLLIYIGVLVGCKKEEGEVAGTDTARTSVTQVEIEFNGAIAHVFATTTDSKPIYRSVFLLTNTAVDSTMTPRHLSELILPDSVNTTELAAATGTGILIKTNTAYHNVTVSPLDKLTIRLVGSDGSTTDVLEPALDNTDADFVKQVPRIYAASANTMTDTELRSELRDATATPDGKDFDAFFLLEGGKFKSQKFCKPTKFKKDHAGLNIHDFGEWITLSGRLKKDPVLLIARGNAAPKAVHFINPGNKLLLQFINQPERPEPLPHSHFEMYRRLAKDPSKFKYPDTWDEIEEIQCDEHGPIPGCSNSAWP